MFREIRKKKNEISVDAVKNLLAVERRGVLAVNGDDGYPYAIPINYIYCDEAWAPYMQSVVVFGRCHLIDNQDEAVELVRKFANKYYPVIRA